MEQVRESNLWVGVGTLLSASILLPIQLVATLGVLGFLILVFATRNLGQALLFDLLFVIGSILWTLPGALAYLIGGMFRLIFRTKQTDSWGTALVGILGIAVALYGFNRFAFGVGWNGPGAAAGYISFAGFALSWLCCLMAGATGAYRARTA